MAEKHSEHIGFNYISKLLNIKEYNTTGNKELFGSKIPDGWLLVGNSLLIIEYKPKAEMKTKGYKQLAKYAKLALTNKPELTIYCFLGLGTDVDTFEKLFMLYNLKDNSMNEIDENKIKVIFSNVTNSVNCQSIHNMLVKNFNYDKAEELHDIITVIISSFLNPDLVEYYKMKTKMITKEFTTLLTENARNLLGSGYDKYLTDLQNTEFKNAFGVCKTIYEAYNNNPQIIPNLFQQFKKYNSYSLSKNEIWTEPEISKIMYTELVNVIERNLKITPRDNLIICDPCIGGGNLLTEFINNYPNLQIKGCDINKRLIMNNKLKLLMSGHDISRLYNESYFDVDNKLLTSDVVICNPPYSKQISKHDCLKFVMKSLEHSHYCCYIMPKNKLLTERKQFEQILNKHTILRIIDVGEIFKHTVSAGEIIIITISREKKNIETEFINLSALADEYKKVIKKDMFKFTQKGEDILKTYFENKINIIKYIPTLSQPYPITEELTLFDNIKANLIKPIEKEINTVNNMFTIPEDSKKIIINELTKSVSNIESKQTINQLIASIYCIQPSSLHEVKLMEYFEIVKPLKIFQSNYNDPGNYPLIAAKNNNNGIIKHINDFSFNANNEKYITLCKQGDGGSGYCFIQTGKFAVTSSVYILKPTKAVNLELNTKILTLQLTNMGFGFSKSINKERLNNLRVYMYTE